MATGRPQPSVVIDVRTPSTHAASVATTEREMGYPPRLVRAPDACYRFQARNEERLPGLVDRWEASGIAARVVLMLPHVGPPSYQGEAVAPERRQPDCSARAVHAWPDYPQERHA
jgi:hypothetical protein